MATPPPLAAALGLQPHPEGGWYAETWRAELQLPVAALPGGYSGPRAAGTAISYLLAPGERSRWHRVRSAELWLWQGGGRLRLALGGDADRPHLAHRVELGPAGERDTVLQHVVRPGEWQSAEPSDEEPALVACVVVPGFDFADFELADD